MTWSWIGSLQSRLTIPRVYKHLSTTAVFEDYSDFLGVWLTGHLTQYEIRALASTPSVCHQQVIVTLSSLEEELEKKIDIQSLMNDLSGGEYLLAWVSITYFLCLNS